MGTFSRLGQWVHTALTCFAVLEAGHKSHNIDAFKEFVGAEHEDRMNEDGEEGPEQILSDSDAEEVEQRDSRQGPLHAQDIAAEVC